jgi:hypothetical protein
MPKSGQPGETVLSVTRNPTDPDPFVRIGPGLLLPRRYTIRIAIEGFELLADVFVDPRGHLHCRRLEVDAIDVEDVRTAVLKRIAIGDLLQRTSSHAALVEEQHADGSTVIRSASNVLEIDVARARASRGPDRETLKRVADVYRDAHNRGEYEVQAVMAALKKPQSTAARWIRLARNAGELGESLGKGRSGEEPRP